MLPTGSSVVPWLPVHKKFVYTRIFPISVHVSSLFIGSRNAAVIRLQTQDFHKTPCEGAVSHKPTSNTPVDFIRILMERRLIRVETFSEAPNV